MYNSDLASDIEKAVQDALATSDFSKLNQNITTAVNTSIAQIGTNQNRFYQQYGNQETTAEELEHIDGEIVNGDARADYNARRQAAQAEAERARYNSRQAVEARRQAAEQRRRQAAEENRRNAAEGRRQENERRRAEASQNQGRRPYDYSGRLREAVEAFGLFGSSASRRGGAGGAGGSGGGGAGGAGGRGGVGARGGGYVHTAGNAGAAHRDGNPTELVPISRNPKGRVSGILLSVFGWVGLSLSVLMLIMFNVFTDAGLMPYYMYDTLMSSLAAPGLFLSGCMTIVGTKRRHRIHRFYQYVRQLRGRAYCPVKELSSHIGRSERFVLKDLRKMIALGMFPEGHIDDQQTCVMLNGATYDQYLKAQNAYLARQLEEKRAGGRISAAARDFAPQDGSVGAGGATGSPAQGTSSHGNAAGGDVSGKAAAEAASQNAAGTANSRATLPPKVIQVLSAGDSYLTKIREANAAIPGEIISMKLDRLEEIIRKIYARIELHPEQVDDLDKFINYYLPTTLKLVDAYRDFDAQSVQGDNIKTAKKEIESTLETIIYAFETLLDSLYEDDALDISTDISVLQTMFAQEGLTKGAFDRE